MDWYFTVADSSTKDITTDFLSTCKGNFFTLYDTYCVYNLILIIYSLAKKLIRTNFEKKIHSKNSISPSPLTQLRETRLVKRIWSEKRKTPNNQQTRAEEEIKNAF